ncbi:MAG TPA: amidase family protein, partial [Burkholderiales bacterium]|nr:amidase family protein [Burkholderiales bacterium]
TQTSSSIIRPAAFCGVIGYKPTFNLVNRAGLKFLAESLDTLGTLSRTIPDTALVVEELSGMAPTSFATVATLKPRIGFCRTPYWSEADAPSRAALENVTRRLAAAGAKVSEIELPGEFARLAQTQIEVSSYEFFRALTHERTRFPQLISASLTARIAAGGRVTREQYEEGCALAQRCRKHIADTFRDFDVLLAPSAPGEAPRGLEATGDPIFGLMWTLLLLPCLTLPCGKGPTGLPLGAQFIGRHGDDATLFVVAEWARRALAPDWD